ncbi:MAG: PQQ-binding-like beta-propeller repeat protein [Thermoguttaceae bacterium]
MSDTNNNAGYQLATRIAAVAAVVAIVVSALLFYDYIQRLRKDPLDSPTYKALTDALDQHRSDESLKEQVRALDLQLRREYFRQRAFTGVGAALLTVAVLTFLLSARIAATLRRRMPLPTVSLGRQDREAAWTRIARWAVAATCAAMIFAAVLLILSVKSPLPDGGNQIASLQNRPRETGPIQNVPGSQSGVESNGRVHPRPPDYPEPPSNDEEFAKAWPRFRGPGGLGISAYTNVPDAWDAPKGKGILWKTPVPLPGNNSPVVWGKRVFLCGADEHRREVYCFDADSGKLLWRENVPGTPQSNARPPKVNDDTGYAAPTTATDGRRVFAIFANGDLAAFDVSGKPAWAKSLGPLQNSYGHASSLLTYKNLLLVQLDQGDSEKPRSKLLAFDSATGGIAWQVDRPVPNSWSSPIVIRVGDRDQLVASSSPWVIGYDLGDGAEVWRVKCLGPDIGPSPVFAAGCVFVANDNAALSAIRADGHGDVTATHIVWKGKDGMPDTCSPLATGEFVFLLTSEGTLTCYDAAKGGALWSEEFDEQCAASPSMVGKRLYIVARSGKAWIVEPGRDKCRRIGQCNLGEECVTSPAFQDGRIYLRGNKHLFCIGKL